jgi:hypothetical protein
MRVLPAGFVPPCLPTKAQEPPSGPMWLHEIKHDGFRVVARKDGAKLRLYSRPDNDLTYRFPLIVEALARLRSKSCIIDGEAVACDGNGMPTFDRIRYRHRDGSVGEQPGLDRPLVRRGYGKRRLMDSWFSLGIQRMAAFASCSELNTQARLISTVQTNSCFPHGSKSAR